MLIALNQSSASHGTVKDPHPITTPSTSLVVGPTTCDVHLYPDQGTCEMRVPLLFADCEGLDGADREPASIKWQRSKNMTTRTTRDIDWAKKASGLKREDLVVDLFAKVLYTFSDVVVFVLRSPGYEISPPELAGT